MVVVEVFYGIDEVLVFWVDVVVGGDVYVFEGDGVGWLCVLVYFVFVVVVVDVGCVGWY